MKIFTVQGPWAAGKSTLLARMSTAYGKEILPVSEFGIQERRTRDGFKLDINKRDDFVTNQEIFYRSEYERVRRLREQGVKQVLFDRGPEDTLCFSKIHPIAISADWDVSAEMQQFAEKYITHRSIKILYLRASRETLVRRRENDYTKQRKTFEAFIDLYYNLELEFYSELPNVSFLDTDDMSGEEVMTEAVRYFGL
jgi:predicted ATPase